jgi:hypothetical protein
MSSHPLPAIWHSTPFVRLPHSNRLGAMLSDETYNFLSKTGLPEKFVYFLFHPLRSRIVPIKEFANSLGYTFNIPENSSCLYTIGVMGYFIDVHADIICLDTTNDEVRILSPNGLVRFMNTNAQNLLMSLTAVNESFVSLSSVKRKPARFYREAARNIRATIRTFDSFALADPDNGGM